MGVKGWDYMSIRVKEYGEFILKSSGKKPEEFMPYLVAYRTRSGKLASMVGIFEPDYDGGNGGFYDGMMAHLEYKNAYAWMELGNLQLIEEE